MKMTIGARELDLEDDACLIDLPDGSLALQLFNQGGYDCVTLELTKLFEWMKKTPELAEFMAEQGFVGSSHTE